MQKWGTENDQISDKVVMGKISIKRKIIFPQGLNSVRKIYSIKKIPRNGNILFKNEPKDIKKMIKNVKEQHIPKSELESMWKRKNLSKISNKRQNIIEMKTKLGEI